MSHSGEKSERILRIYSFLEYACAACASAQPSMSATLPNLAAYARSSSVETGRLVVARVAVSIPPKTDSSKCVSQYGSMHDTFVMSKYFPMSPRPKEESAAPTEPMLIASSNAYRCAAHAKASELDASPMRVITSLFVSFSQTSNGNSHTRL